jgi:hypothetical protein
LAGSSDLKTLGLELPLLPLPPVAAVAIATEAAIAAAAMQSAATFLQKLLI